MTLKGFIWRGIAAILLFVVGFVYVYDGSVPAGNSRQVDGKYIRFIFIGSSACAIATSEVTQELVRDLKHSFEQFATSMDYRFVSTGISVDRNAETGVRFLENSGPYDKIIAGSSWMNLGVDRYIWHDFPGYASTPQVVVTLTEFTTSYAAGQVAMIDRSERLLSRTRNVAEMTRLYELMIEEDADVINRELGLISDTLARLP